MFTSIGVVINKKTKTNPNFKILNAQKICEECENVIAQELKTDKISILSFKDGTITVFCKNKIISNEIQIRKKYFLEKIKKEIKVDLKNIKVV